MKMKLPPPIYLNYTNKPSNDNLKIINIYDKQAQDKIVVDKTNKIYISSNTKTN